MKKNPNKTILGSLKNSHTTHAIVIFIDSLLLSKFTESYPSSLRLSTPYDPALNDTDSKEFHQLAEEVCGQVKKLFLSLLCSCFDALQLGSQFLHGNKDLTLSPSNDKLIGFFQQISV